jgi:ParB/RepB/Spo0J family partition protein
LFQTTREDTMNAPNTAEQLGNRFASIAITDIYPSQTSIQNLRRSHFDPNKIAELAASIKQSGVLQPILVRPRYADMLVTQRVPEDGFEIVAGERRWLAAKEAGLTAIDCHVRPLTDAQLLEAQLVENLQREGVHPLEEAEGYRALAKLRGITPEQLATEIGKSRAYVYARLKLLELAPEAREALDVGDLDASKALVVARFGAKLQAKIIKDYRSGANGRTSYRQFVESVRSMFMTDLTAAPFKLNDEHLHQFVKVKKGVEEAIALPACVNCPNYSRNDLELQAEFGTDAHVCIDRDCHDVKVVSFHDRLRLAAKNAGRSILTGDQAKAAMPDDSHWSDGFNAQWLRLDATCRDDLYENTVPEPDRQKFKRDEDYEAACEAWQDKSDDYVPRTFLALLQPLDASLIQLAEDRKGRLVELYPVDIAAHILAKRHIALDVPKP